MKVSCLNWSNKDSIRSIMQELKHDNIVLGTSDTILGLLAPITKGGYTNLNEIKGRAKKPFIVLISDPKKVSLFAETITPEIERLIDNCWPGPLTIIVKAKKDLPTFLTSKDGTIALRVPDHKGLLSVLQHFDGLFSTSANKTDQPVPEHIEDVDPEIIKKSVCCIRDDDKKPVVPSTILDCTGAVIKVLRVGVFPVKQLEKITGKPFEQ